MLFTFGRLRLRKTCRATQCLSHRHRKESVSFNFGCQRRTAEASGFKFPLCSIQVSQNTGIFMHIEFDSHICLRSYQRCEIGHEASRHSAGHVSTNKTKQRFCMQGAHGNSNKAIGMDQRCPLLGGKRSNWVTSNSIQIHVRCPTCWSSATAKWDEGCMSLKKGNHAQGRLKWKIDFPCHTLYCTWYVFYPSKGKVWKDNRIRADFQIIGTVMHENSSDRIETTQRKKLMMILSKLMTSYGIAIKLTKNREPQVHSYWFSGRILLDPRAYPYVFFFSVTSWQMDEHPSAHPYGGDVSRQNSKVGDVFPGFVFHPGVFSVLFRWAY